MMKIVEIIVLIFLLSSTLKTAQGSFRVQIILNSLDNRGGRCADQDAACSSGEGCCESSTCAVTTCNYNLFYCLRLPPVFEISPLRRIDTTACTVNNAKNTDIIRFQRRLQNVDAYQIIISNTRAVPSTVQIYMEVQHNKTVLIDRFVLEIPGVVGTLVGPTIVNGVFGKVTLNISTIIICTQESQCGPTCNTMNCTSCSPGFTGVYCSEMLSYCGDVYCNNSNMQCADSALDSSCVCLPGFTGIDCLTDIDECSNGQELCNSNGVCINTQGSFMCHCSEGFTGQFCDTSIEGFVVEVLFHSFKNPGGRCANAGGTCASGTGCCDHSQCLSTVCDYMFHFCLRPIGSHISFMRSENRGNCDNFVETNSHNAPEEDTFSSSLYGIANPARLFSATSPINKMEFYLELIDDDHNQFGEENNELIDRYAIVINENITREKFHGIFNLSTVTLSISVYCSAGYHHDECDALSTSPSSTNPIPSTSSLINVTTISPNSRSKSETNVVIVAIIAAVLGISCFLGTCMVLLYCLYRRKNKTSSVTACSPTPLLEMRSNGLENVHQDLAHLSRSQGSAMQSIRERLESIPNIYNHLRHITNRNKSTQAQQDVMLSPQITNNERETQFSSVYEDIDNDMPGIGNKDVQTSTARLGPYEFHPLQCNDSDDEYDYDTPYWAPSNEERELLSQLKKLRIPSASIEDIRELEILGTGAFGTVHKAIWSHRKGKSDNPVEEEVAIKSIEGGASEDERVSFLQEAAIMGQFNHPNIVKIVGVVANIELDQYKLILELLHKGNLRQFLSTLDTSCETLSSQLLAFSRQIASGMNYLAIKDYAHRDLAARNVLVSNDEICKIGDFGLSKCVQYKDYHLASRGKVPVKWAAPESLNNKVWSTASDVWSYGCVLYEIWSLRYKPFHNCNNGEVLLKISQGYRLPPPPGCPRVIYELMISCWNTDPKERPSFSEIGSSLNRPDYKITTWTSEDKLKYSEEAKTIGGSLKDGKALYEELQNKYKVA